MSAPVRLQGGKRRGRTALKALSTVLIVAGALLLIDAGITLLWQEPVSALYASLRQNALGDDLNRIETRRIARVEVQALKRLQTEKRRLTFLAGPSAARPTRAIRSAASRFRRSAPTS
jgi:sortase A